MFLGYNMSEFCTSDPPPSSLFQVTAQERPGWEDGASPDPKALPWAPAAAWGGLWEQSKHRNILDLPTVLSQPPVICGSGIS